MTETAACGKCGAFGDLTHEWVEGDCILAHKGHSRRLVEGTFVCEPCVERWDKWLVEIVELYAGLHTVLLVSDVTVDDLGEYQKPRKAPASPSPLRLTAWALLYGTLNDHVVEVDYDATGRRETVRDAYMGANLPNIPEVLAGWAEAVWDAAEWGSGWPTTVTGASAAIRANRTTVAAMPDVDTFDAELRWVRRALRQAHGIQNPTPLGACLTVDCGGNVWPAPSATPKCDRCSRRYGTNDLVRLKMNERQAS